MKYLLVLALALAVTACKEDKQDQPVPTPTPVVVEPTPVPPTPTPVVEAPVCPENKAPTLKCYDLPPCAGLFASVADAIAALDKIDGNGAHCIDGVVVKGGFGPCSQCDTVGKVQMKSAHPSLADVLKARDGKTRLEVK